MMLQDTSFFHDAAEAPQYWPHETLRGGPVVTGGGLAQMLGVAPVPAPAPAPVPVPLMAPEPVSRITGLAAQSLIKTMNGEMPLAQVAAGDHVLTRDNGYQPVRWHGKLAGAATPGQAHVRIRAGAFGAGGPERDLTLAADQRLLSLTGAVSEGAEGAEAGAEAGAESGGSEMLIRARDLLSLEGVELCDAPDIGAGPRWQILFDRHELILANDMWTETWQPELAEVMQLPEAARAQVMALCPKLARAGCRRAFPAARRQTRAFVSRWSGGCA